MFVIPAIDLKGGQCVRLLQGKEDAVTIYSNDPASTAKKWEECGAKLLHVVDLDGAVTGELHNLEIITQIASAVLVPVQCEFFALEGLSQLLKTVEQVKANLNPSLTIHGIVLSIQRGNVLYQTNGSCDFFIAPVDDEYRIIRWDDNTAPPSFIPMAYGKTAVAPVTWGVIKSVFLR